MNSASDYIQSLQTNGRLTFSTSEIVKTLGKSVPAIRAQLRRLKEKSLIADPFRGFHVVVPPKYRSLGCLPAEQFVPQLMKHLETPYYVCLLSAAAYYGAAHQSPMVFQVMTPKPMRNIKCGKVQVEFITRKDMETTPTLDRNTPAEIIRVATPEATALELVGYPERCGYLDNVATVLAELAESITGKALADEAHRSPNAWVQRLGYLLCLTGQDKLAQKLEKVLTKEQLFTVPLAPWEKINGSLKDQRWKVSINTTVEPDV